VKNFIRETSEKQAIGSLKEKERHGCLTSWLILTTVISVMFIILYLGRAFYRQYTPDLPWWTIPVLVIIQLSEITCIIALFKWKKWGFWYFCVACGTAGVVNILLRVNVTAIGAFVSIAVTFIVLNIGKENKGWSQLD